MIIYPAIDLQNGQVVRLSQGQFDQVVQYGNDPLEFARHWVKKGARWLHVVDLDGAKTGGGANRKTICHLAQALSVPVQTGGGIRDMASIENLLAAGVTRVILGTRAVEDPDFVKKAVKRWGSKIAVSLDCHNGFIAQHGWTETTSIKATDFVKTLEDFGLSYLVYTDIHRDGMLTGPNWDALDEMFKATSIPLIASGGVATLNDIKKLKKWQSRGLDGVITGKALYESRLDLTAALQVADGLEPTTSET